MSSPTPEELTREFREAILRIDQLIVDLATKYRGANTVEELKPFTDESAILLSARRVFTLAAAVEAQVATAPRASKKGKVEG